MTTRFVLDVKLESICIVVQHTEHDNCCHMCSSYVYTNLCSNYITICMHVDQLVTFCFVVVVCEGNEP